MLRNAARVIGLLSVTTAMAQSAPLAQTAPGGAAAPGQDLAGRRVASLGPKRTGSVQSENSLRHRMEDLEYTLNLEVQELRVAEAAREDMEARRVALYSKLINPSSPN